MKKPVFRNIENKRIREAFAEVHSRYEALHDAEIVLERKVLKGSTMQAQPVISLVGLFGKIESYRISLAKHVRDTENLLVNELPEDVLRGWFAHELGHVVDYHSRSPIEMLGYGIRYLSSGNYRRMVEHKADQIAFEHGFLEDVLKTKEFLFHNDLIKEEYRRKMMRYYMSIDEARNWMKENIQIDPVS